MLKVPEVAHKVQAAEDRERAWLEKEFGDELKQAAEQLDRDREQDKQESLIIPPSSTLDREFAPEEPPPVFDVPHHHRCPSRRLMMPWTKPWM